MAKYLSYSGLQYLVDVIKTRFVQKESGKTLSDNNYSDAEKSKLATLRTYEVATTEQNGLLSSSDKGKLDAIPIDSEANRINTIKRNGSIVQISNKEVNITVPVNISELTNDSNFQTRSEVQQLISQAGNMRKEIVETLPPTGQENTIYLKGPKAGTGNVYEEYLWIAGSWELIGSTETQVDLSDYLLKTEIEPISNQEITQIVEG